MRPPEADSCRPFYPRAMGWRRREGNSLPLRSVPKRRAGQSGHWPWTDFACRGGAVSHKLIALIAAALVGIWIAGGAAAGTGERGSKESTPTPPSTEAGFSEADLPDYYSQAHAHREWLRLAGQIHGYGGHFSSKDG